ncbi:hypothetical protein A7U60_g8785 [Sanghuangporus baumii]|uniref:SRR1-like domain-containing protein n=1 Tax=Sanghuangporus baumii TaxID=108892 RepID=A0A9Q5HQS8_SANBA|nr:hypothetical protein A7U60_g8785 [Sanghuangporus baumii]
MKTGTEATERGFASSYSDSATSKPNAFTLVARKKKKNRNGKGATMKVFTPEQKLEKSRAELHSDSNWLDAVSRTVHGATANLPAAAIQSILCLGLGSPSESAQARFQLSFLLELRDKILPEGKHELEGATLAFMPHCDRVLYENFLRANWRPEAIADLLLIGNDLRGIPSRVLGKESPCISRLAPLLASTPLPEHRAFPDAFSSTAVQHFDTASLNLTYTTTELSALASSASSSIDSEVDSCSAVLGRTGFWYVAETSEEDAIG